MRFKGLDLNLLVALEVLLTTRSITETAKRMNLSQPAVSAALGRLRDHFGDPLLVLNGKRFLPTTTAETLLPLVRQLLRDAETMLQAGQRFEPASSQRTFRIIASDYMAVVLLTRVAARLGEVAPHVCLDIIPPSQQSGLALDNGQVDLLIGPDAFVLARFPSELLFEERHVIVGCANNPLFSGAIAMADYAAAGHVVATFGPNREASFADQVVEKLGIERRIAVTTSSFASLPWFLVGTPRLALMHGRLAAFFARIAPLAVAEPPFAMPLQQVVMQHHPARRGDMGLQWLTGLVRDEAAVWTEDGTPAG